MNLIFNLRCKFRLKCTPYFDKMKINANDQLDLKGSCLSGCDKESTTFTYYLYMLNSSSNQWISFTNNSYYFYTGLNPQTDLTIKYELFQNLSSQTIWKVELNVYVPTKNTSGSTSILFIVNFPPRNGLCDINPKNGTTNTLYSISCWNWIDPDGNVDSYAYCGIYFLKFFFYKNQFMSINFCFK
jgi:hypothetical protein